MADLSGCAGGWHENDPVEPQRLVGIARGQEVADVGRVERAAEDADAHALKSERLTSVGTKVAALANGLPSRIGSEAGCRRLPPSPSLPAARIGHRLPAAGHSAATAGSAGYAVRSVRQVSAASGRYFSSGRRYTTTISISASRAILVSG